MASNHLGVSGMNVNTMALNKLIVDVHVKNKRHGLYFIENRLKLQSIGMTAKANGDITTQTAQRAMLTNAEARAAVVEV